MSFPRVTETAHDLVTRFVREGDHVVDATVGNGHDTRFLASLVGAAGRVDGFDIQSGAIEATARELHGLPQVNLHCLGHEHLREVVPGPVAAVMFNLGYLPSGDKTLVTRPDTTLAALDAAWELLKAPGGILSVVVYPGHAGGSDESLLVEAWFSRLDPVYHRTLRHGPAVTSPQKPGPFLLAAVRGRKN
jgi:predicted methyltransferase